MSKRIEIEKNEIGLNQDFNVEKAKKKLQKMIRKISIVSLPESGLDTRIKQTARQLRLLMDIREKQRSNASWKAAIQSLYDEKNILPTRPGAAVRLRLVRLCYSSSPTGRQRFATILYLAENEGWDGEELERRLIKSKGINPLARKRGWGISTGPSRKAKSAPLDEKDYQK